MRVRVRGDVFSLIYVYVINAVISYTICRCINNKFGDQNTHFVVIISQLKISVIKTQLFADQKNVDPIFCMFFYVHLMQFFSALSNPQETIVGSDVCYFF